LPLASKPIIRKYFAFFILRRDEQLACKGCEEQAAIGLIPRRLRRNTRQSRGVQGLPWGLIPIIDFAFLFVWQNSLSFGAKMIFFSICQECIMPARCSSSLE
jgi:hypothetical protein